MNRLLSPQDQYISVLHEIYALKMPVKIIRPILITTENQQKKKGQKGGH